MKYLINLSLVCSVLLFSFLFSHCDLNSSEETTIIPYEEILMECMDMVSIGGKFEAVINSQEEYEKLIYDRFQMPLDYYWDTNYDATLQFVQQQYPGLTDEEYERLVLEMFYSALPFKGTENCSHPEINFDKYTLLGQAAHTSGCELPEYIIEVERNRSEYVYRVTIKRIGDCEMAISKNKWILIPKIPREYPVKFEIIQTIK